MDESPLPPAGAARLGAVCGGRDNNLNLIRMIAASAVLVSHAFSVVGVREPIEPVFGRSLGHMAVAVFFVISGFLISRAWERKPGVGHWLASRALRMYPGLAVVLVLTVLVLGPATTTLPLARYFAAPETWRYVPINLSLAELRFGLPGVFEHLPYPGTINGSLWTLIYEVICYGAVAAAGAAGLLRRPRAFALALTAYLVLHAAVLTTAPHAGRGNQLDSLADLSFPFACGMAAWVWRERLVLSGRIAAALALPALLLRPTALAPEALYLALGYATLWAGYALKGRALAYNRLGDYSYGVYIYAFPLQQLMVWLVPGQSWWTNVALAFPATLTCAVLSWTLVERPALALVRSGERGRAGPAGAPAPA